MSTDEGDRKWMPDHLALDDVSVGTITGVVDIITNSYINTSKTRGFLLWRRSPRRRLKQRLEQAIGEASHDAMGVLLSLIADCDLRAYDSRLASKRWARAYYLLGLPAAILATIAGAAGLGSTAGRIPAAIIALFSAGLSAAATFLNSNDNKQQSTKISAAWQELADDVRLAILRYRVTSTEPPHLEMISDVIGFNKRKAALLRGEISEASKSTPSDSG